MIIPTGAILAEGLTLTQCANGGIKDNVSHMECHVGWISGNANKSKATYREGDLLPYRVVMTGLTPGNSYSYSFSWDTLKSGKHAIDYIGTFNADVASADPCDGVAATCPGTVSTIAIPADPVITGAGVTPTAGDMTLYGGAISSIGPYGSAVLADGFQSISVEFVPDQSTAVLTWGGHISTPIDWGAGNTASAITGSPYHTSNIALLNSQGQSVAKGEQDVALSAAAVYVPSSINVTKLSNAPGTFSFVSYFDTSAHIPPDGETNPWTLTMGQEKSISAPDDGMVTITETALPAGDWRIKSITCSKGGAGTVFSYVYGQGTPTDTAEFEANEAATFSCVFENEFFGAPSLRVVKRVVGASDTCTDSVRNNSIYDTRNIHSGEAVKYCFWITNSGSDPALDVTLADDRAGLAPVQDIPLTGGSNLNANAIPDLGPGDVLSGELSPVQLNVALSTIVINTATARGTGKTDGAPYSASDTAQVTADQASNCTLSASVFAGAGACPGTSTAYVIKGSPTGVTWCADVGWDNMAALPLTNISVALQGTVVSNTAGNMAPNTSLDIPVGQYKEADDYTGTLVLTGSEGNLNAISCSGQATINVLDPGLNLIKLASTDNVCGNGDDAHDVEIINGDSVWYCLTVINSGDSPLENVSIDDSLLGVNIPVPDLLPGDEYTWKSSERTPGETVTNTAVATSTEPETGTTVDSDESSATVTVVSADIEVEKTSEPGNIVLCDPPDAHDFCSEQDGSGIFDVSYQISVTNLGPNDATGVTVSDELPVGFIYGGNDLGCDYDLPSHLLECNLGDMAPADVIEITVTGQIDLNLFDTPWQRIRNQACANTDPARLDPNPGNNCDSTATHVSTGPTRTIGWWSTHPYGLESCLALDDVDLGFVVIGDELIDNQIDATVSTNPTAKGKSKSSLMTATLRPDKDADISSGPVLAKGLLNGGVSRWKDGTKRSHIGQARVKAGKQLTAAWCNEAVHYSEFDSFFLGWDVIQRVMRGESYLSGLTEVPCGGPCAKQDIKKVIASINFIGSVADSFNNSGDDLPIALPPQPADPHAPEDDPTDPVD